MDISVKEFKPATELLPFIESYWAAHFNCNRSADFSRSVIPNGCIELIIHLGDDHCALNKNGEKYQKSPPFTLMGVYKKSYVVKFSALVRVFGVRFYPDGFRNIFGVPPSEFLSTYENGVDVVGKEFKEFCLRIKEKSTSDACIHLANHFLTRQLGKNRNPHDYSHRVMKLIRHAHGRINFEELTRKTPISLRQLQRDFKTNYGFKITDYIRLSRLNAINKYMMSHNINLTELAYEMEFTDQSHFIREFKHFAGIAPKGFLKHAEEFIVNAV